MIAIFRLYIQGYQLDVRFGSLLDCLQIIFSVIKLLNLLMGVSLLALSKSIYYIWNQRAVEVVSRGRLIFQVSFWPPQQSLKNFRQMVLVFNFGTEKSNEIEMYYLQTTGKFFAFSRHEAWHW